MSQIPEIVSVVHQAIEHEKEAISMYLHFARLTKDNNAKNVLINLATDEVGHMTKLEDYLSALLRGQASIPGGMVAAESIAAAMTRSATLEEFDKAELEKADEVRILELAIDKEIKANLGYLEMAGKAHSDDARAMFLSLAVQEDLHARILRAEVDALGQDGFWFDMQEFTMEKQQ
jgi:rubrerythrin